MSFKCKLLLVDLDGTVARDNFDVSPKIISRLKKASKDLMISIATSRSANSVIQYLNVLDLTKGLHIVEAGSKIIDNKGNTLYITYFPQSIVLKIVDFLFSQKASFKICFEGKSYRIPEKNELKNKDLTLITRITVLGITKQNLNTIEMYLKKLPVSYYFSKNLKKNSFLNIDITTKGVDKGSGAARVRKMLHVSKEETWAVGDGLNDIPLMNQAGFKIAMGNSDQELKKIVDFIAPSVYDDGLLQALTLITHDN